MHPQGYWKGLPCPIRGRNCRAHSDGRFFHGFFTALTFKPRASLCEKIECCQQQNTPSPTQTAQRESAVREHACARLSANPRRCHNRGRELPSQGTQSDAWLVVGWQTAHHTRCVGQHLSQTRPTARDWKSPFYLLHFPFVAVNSRQLFGTRGSARVTPGTV